MPRSALSATLAAAWLLGAASTSAQFRLPAIDRTGEHLFNGTTTLAPHDLLHGLFHKHQQPAAAPAAVAPVAVAPAVVGPVAIATPPVKPPCAPPVIAVPVAPVVPVVPVAPVAAPACGPQQTPLPARPQVGGPICPPPQCAPRGPQISITPSRIVAPINTEVVLAAGICSPDGYYVTRQPLEWMLAQDGVGQIVMVGHESPHDVSYVLRDSPQKVATNYARAHTSTISQVLDRGTPSRADDVYLQKGQSWISLTSPTEGTTHVVVWAPKEHNWERRKTTATIYWVDASWKFPPCTAARSGAAHPLTTVVTRASGEPIANWLVRYEVQDGPPATFDRGATTVEVRTDAAGRATARLLPASLEAGVTPVKVQIIRPASGRGDLPQMVVGQGNVAVQWTSPGLTVLAMGPSQVSPDGAIGYRVNVSNSGDLMTRGVTLSYTPPAGVSVLNSTPPFQPFGQRLEWRLGDLPPGTTSTIELNCRATIPGSIRSSFVATSADGLKSEGRHTAEFRANALSVKMVGPDVVDVGREARFLIDVTNTGPTTLTGVVAKDTFDPGLVHTGGEASPLVRALPPLAPGQVEKFAVAFTVSRPGQLCHRLDVTADGGHGAGARACLTGTAPQVTPAQLSVQLRGPATSRAGEVAQYAVDVRNSGSAPATNVVLSVTWGINLQLTEATRGHEDDLTRLTTRWRIPQIAGGETLTRQFNCMCLNPDEAASVRATVSSQQTTEVGQQIRTTITPGAAPPPRLMPMPPAGAAPPSSPPAAAPPAAAPPVGAAPRAAAPVAGNLTVSAAVTSDPIMVGGTTTLIVNLTNDRTVPDREVALSVQALDDGLTISRVVGTTATPVTGTSGTAIDFAPIREMRPGERLDTPYRIELRGAKPGRHRIRITARSELAPAGSTTEVEVAVNAT